MRHCYNCESFELINVLYFFSAWPYENQRSNMSTAILFVYCYIRRSCSFHCTDRGKSYLLLSKNCVKTPSIFWQIVCFSVACNLNAELKPNMRIFVLNEVYLAALKIFHDVFRNHTCNQNYQWFN